MKTLVTEDIDIICVPDYMENIEKAMQKVVPPTKQNMFELNMKAVRLGFDY